MPPLTSLSAANLTVWSMFESADFAVRSVMIGLLLASIVTWTILFAKWIELAGARRELRAAVAAARSEPSLDALSARLRQTGGRGETLLACAQAELLQSEDLPVEGVKERISLALYRAEAAFARKFASGTGILASIGACAPFVGLFGTVWGIMNSFIGISQAQTTNLAVVAPGIAEALLATATGLFAAIPAVLIYNLFVRVIAANKALVGDLSAAILATASRDLDRAAALAEPHARFQVRELAE